MINTAAKYVKYLGGGLVIIFAAYLLWGLLAAVFSRGELTDIPLILGVATMGITPGLILFYLGRHLLQNGASIGAGLVAIIFGLPVLGLGIGLKIVTQQPLALSFLVGLFGALMMIWGLIIMRSRNKPNNVDLQS